MKSQVETIRNYYGKIIGYIETDTQGNKVIKNFYKKILGKYDKRTNVTKDYYGRIIARGDQSALLLGLTTR